MNPALISSAIALINTVLPLITSSPQIASVVSTVEALIPVVVQEGVDVMPAIKNIIGALSANPAATADQLTALGVLDAQVDAAFDAAAAAFNAAHPAA